MTLATLVSIVVVLLVAGLAVWILGKMPIDETIKRIIWAILVVAVVAWTVTQFLGRGWFAFA